MNELEDQIKKLNTKCSFGLDGDSNMIIKKLTLNIRKYLLN